MLKEHFKYLACPDCHHDLELEIKELKKNIIINGNLTCTDCGQNFTIIDGIPRFVPEDNYCENFGLQWNIHDVSQYDRHSNSVLTKTRFVKETKWDHDLKGQVILEAGCGSGRFTEHCLSTGAMVVSCDYSTAVDANRRINGDKNNLLIVQADICRMPFKDKSFDKIFCFGVLQHTPDPESAFECLTKKLKHQGQIAIDIYKFTIWEIFKTKYLVRPFIKNINKKKLYALCRSYINSVWPFTTLIMKIFPNIIGRKINWQLLVPDYSQYNLDEKILKEWAYLDIYDMLSPKYDKPRRKKTVLKWFEKYNFREYEVQYGYNGIEARGRKI